MGEDASLAENARRVALLALAMQRACAGFAVPGGGRLQMRIGLHVGPAVGGVVGVSMLRYHLFGSLCEEVTLLEQTCEPGQVHVSRGFVAALGGPLGAERLQATLVPAGDIVLDERGAPEASFHLVPLL